MHDNLLKAINFAMGTRTGSLRNLRVEDAGYALLKVDVVKTDTLVGEVWVGGDEEGYISTYTVAGLEGDCEPLETADPSSPLPELVHQVRDMVDRLLASTEHRLTLTSVRWGRNGEDTTYGFTIPGREGEYTCCAGGEIFDHQGMPTTPTYSDGASAMADLLDLTGRTWEELQRLHEVVGIEQLLDRLAETVVENVNG